MLHDDFGFVGLLGNRLSFITLNSFFCSDFFLFNMSLCVFYVNMSFCETHVFYHL